MTSSYKWLAALVGCAPLVIAGGTAAETFDRGQALYENHCTSCHDESVHQRDTRRATSRAELRKWVATWSFHASLDWSGEEIDDVTDFMDRRYYHFTTQP